jgi:hypothetical protein
MFSWQQWIYLPTLQIWQDSSSSDICWSKIRIRYSQNLIIFGRYHLFLPHLSSEAIQLQLFISVLNKQETQGICVAAYKTNEFPAFFTERSGREVRPFSWLTFSFQAPSDFNLQNVKIAKSVWFVAMYTHFLGLHHLTTFCLRKEKEKRKSVYKGTLTGFCGVRCLGSPPRIRNLDQIDHIS